MALNTSSGASLQTETNSKKQTLTDGSEHVFARIAWNKASTLRLRCARNLSNFDLPATISAKEREELLNTVTRK
jgi:hypothetical protein